MRSVSRVAKAAAGAGASSLASFVPVIPLDATLARSEGTSDPVGEGETAGFCVDIVLWMQDEAQVRC